MQTKGDYRIVLIPCEFERARADVQIVLNSANQVAGFFVRPAASTTPFIDSPYVDRSTFTEREITVDAGGWPLPGTLTMPNGAGPWPAVVLVQGSGPSDRDETIGPNKIFRDLAHGLGSKGIAVLRYEKRTRQFGPKIAPLTTFTVKEETIDDAVAAVELLRKTSGIDPRRVFVAGHSLGGMVAPRIATAAGASVRGLIVLAGAVRSLEQSIIDQSRYLAELDGTRLARGATAARGLRTDGRPHQDAQAVGSTRLFPTVQRAGFLLRRPPRLQPAGGGGEARHPDADPAGRPRLSGDDGRLRQVESGAERAVTTSRSPTFLWRITSSSSAPAAARRRNTWPSPATSRRTSSPPSSIGSARSK